MKGHMKKIIWVVAVVLSLVIVKLSYAGLIDMSQRYEQIDKLEESNKLMKENNALLKEIRDLIKAGK